MELTEAILRRRSGRKYLATPLPEEAIRAICQAGLLSPSSRNLKPLEFLVVQDRAALEALAGAKAAGSGMLKNASCAIVVTGDSIRSDAWIEDGSLAMGFMMLKATELGIANCWVQIRNRASGLDGISAEQIIQSTFQIPKEQCVLAILSLGYPEEELPAHTLTDADFRKVHWESFE